MTLHIDLNYTCSECGAKYIPYDDVKCPRCEYYEEKRFDLILQVVRSLKINKASYGKYQPPAWWEGSFADYIIRVMFTFLDDFDEKFKEKVTFQEFIGIVFDEIEWEHEYHREYMKEVAKKVWEKLNETSLY